MSNSPTLLVEAASSVATLGACQSDIDDLDEASLKAGMAYLRELDRHGILLCRYHHMLIHNQGWEIIKDDHGGYRLKPPKERDPRQRLIEMPSKNPLVAAMQHARKADQTLAS